MKNKKKDGRANNGGSRPGAGRKLRDGEPTRVLYKRVPASLYDKCLAAVKAVLDKNTS